MIIIPAIDLKDGRCVTACAGRFPSCYGIFRNPVEIAKSGRKMEQTRIHVVDLDGSLAGSPQNRDVIRKIVEEIEVPIQVGGGIREIKTIDDLYRQ